jgi:hypothetical protein
MEMPTPDAPTGAELAQPKKAEPAQATEAPKRRAAASARLPSVIVVLVVAVATLSLWYLVRPEPLLVQGEADAKRFEIAARVDGRVGEIPDQNAKIASRWSNENTGRLDTVTPS